MARVFDRASSAGGHVLDVERPHREGGLGAGHAGGELVLLALEGAKCLASATPAFEASLIATDDLSELDLAIHLLLALPGLRDLVYALDLDDGSRVLTSQSVAPERVPPAR